MTLRETKTVQQSEPPSRPPVEPLDIVPLTPEVAGLLSRRAAGQDGGYVGPLGGNPTGGTTRVAAITALQRRHGNAALQRLLAREAAAGWGRAVQRHTSVALEEEENAIRRMPIQRDLAAEITKAVGTTGWFPDEDEIFAAIDRASADEKRAILNNPPMMADLRKVLHQGDLLTALRKLGAPLADQLDLAMEVPKTFAAALAAQVQGIKADAPAIFAAIESPAASPDQKAAGLRNSALMPRLRSHLSRAQACIAMRELGAPLGEQLVAATEGGEGDVPAIVMAIGVAPAEQKLAARRDRALVTRLVGALSQDVALT